MVKELSDEEKLARIRLNSFFFLRTDWIWRFLDIYGSAREILKKSPKELAVEGGLSFDTAGKLFDKALNCRPDEEMELAEKSGARLIFFEDEDYPQLLKEIYDPPLMIYVKGEIKPQVAVAVVGSRKPTNYGVRTCAKIAGDMALNNITVVSGLARGIDSVAHDAVIRNKGNTLAVLGAGLNVLYPRENKKLSEKIIETGGALISEFPMETQPMPQHFPRRNRIISGLSYSTLVIEGSYRSGSLITAKSALEQGREILAVPGQIDSEMGKGPNKLIKEGAGLCETAMDIILSLPPEALYNLNLNPGKVKAGQDKNKEAKIEKLGVFEKEIYTVIAKSEGGIIMDAIIQKVKCSVPAASTAVFELETEGLIVMFDGKYKETVV
ncbi:MAG: DNA-processing protein DprA [Elusimicrobiota bacterium]|nr:DNA-processing protein DprA [Elusimicrobiota bacterium]